MRFQLLAKGDFIKHQRTAGSGKLRRWKSEESLPECGPATVKGLVRINQVIEEKCREGVRHLQLEDQGFSDSSSALIEKITVSFHPSFNCATA
ncbi:hypothetical protein [Pontibacter liquoris]|uniref:hypothetical protein n=1 Tax=Pontibacter liquoris TaxID=2905677 RepID=UPI001FA7742B|nr:hypothetical protein [Pontibacter liquoris]